MSVTFEDAALFALHDQIGLPGGPVSGTWQPDARKVSPSAVVTGGERTAFLASLNGGEGGFKCGPPGPVAVGLESRRRCNFPVLRLHGGMHLLPSGHRHLGQAISHDFPGPGAEVASSLRVRGEGPQGPLGTQAPS